MSAKTPDPAARMAELHATWNSCTGQNLPLILCDYAREFGYHQFIKAGFNEKDIVEVVRYLKRKIKEGTRLEGALRWSNCVGDICRFAEDLAMCRAEERNRKPPPTPLQRVLEQARPTAATMTPKDAQITARPVGELIANLRRAAGMEL
jgi:hypothetical protein